MTEPKRAPAGHAPHFKFEGSIGLGYGKAVSMDDHLRLPDGRYPHYVSPKQVSTLGLPDARCPYRQYGRPPASPRRQVSSLNLPHARCPQAFGV